MKTDQYKKAVIYIATDFEPNLKFDLTSSISNIKFEHVQNRNSHDDMIDLQQLEELIKRDANDTLSYPFMVIANAGKFHWHENKFDRYAVFYFQVRHS